MSTRRKNSHLDHFLMQNDPKKLLNWIVYNRKHLCLSIFHVVADSDKGKFMVRLCWIWVIFKHFYGFKNYWFLMKAVLFILRWNSGIHKENLNLVPYVKTVWFHSFVTDYEPLHIRFPEGWNSCYMYTCIPALNDICFLFEDNWGNIIRYPLRYNCSLDKAIDEFYSTQDMKNQNTYSLFIYRV